MDGADGIVHSDDHYSCLDSASETSLAISQDEGGMSQKSDLAELTCVSDVPKKLSLTRRKRNALMRLHGRLVCCMLGQDENFNGLVG
jgi:hypothetical protein